MALSSLSKSLLSRMSMSAVAPITVEPSGKAESFEDGSFSHMLNRDLYPQRKKVVEDGCSEDLEPFELLSGESIEYIGSLQEDFVISISNYRLFATQSDGFYSVPLGLIESVELQSTKDVLLILCKDARTFRLPFSSSLKCRMWQERLVEVVRRPARDLRSAFAFVHRAYRKDLKLEGVRVAPAEDRSNVNGFVNNEDMLNSPLLSLEADSAKWREEIMTEEYRRMGVVSPTQTDLENRVWRISQMNDKYEMCSTYPKLVIVPTSVSDDVLAEAAKFRMLGRVPAVVWRHPANGAVIARSSQPQVGVLGWRSPEDEKLLLAISNACAIDTESPYHTPRAALTHHSQLTASSINHIQLNGIANGGSSFPRQHDVESHSEYNEEWSNGSVKLMVFDLRSYTAALGNRAKGGGCECTDYYPNCEIQYKSLPNIHSVRKSFQQLRAVINSDDQSNFLSNLENTQWMLYLSQLLSVASEVVGVVNDRALPVLVHCSDGWDRTPQIVALAELLLDPYYRTIKGLKVLVEREWIGYGHKFGDRCGHTSEDPNQRSPVFLQWLDCVHQLMRQFPCSFEYNVNYLVKLGQHCYSCLYGTFLRNSMRERGEGRVTEDTTPVWSFLHNGNTDFINYLYKVDTEVLHPVTHIQNMLLWKEMYCVPSLNKYPPETGWDLTPATPPFHPSSSDEAESANSPMSLHPNGPMLNDSTENEPSRGEEYVMDDKTTSSTNVESELVATTNDIGKVACEHEMLFHSCSSSNANSQDSHESLHAVARRESLQEQDQALYSKNDHAFCRGDGDNFAASTTPSPPSPPPNPPSSIIEMQPMRGDTGPQPQGPPQGITIPSTDSLSPPTVTQKQNVAQLNTSLLQDAMCDLSPHAAATLLGHSESTISSEHTEVARSTRGKKGNLSLVLGVDGIPCHLDTVHVRLRELNFKHQKEVRDLEETVREMKRKVDAAGAVKTEVGGVEVGRVVEGEELSDGDLQSPDDKHSSSSLNSWDCVNHEEGQGVRWVPDHAVSNCQGCGASFWTALRKHHCRSCGGVFCGQCTNYFCPVPHEQLFQDVRVCEKCFYKLDGHLKQARTQPSAPT